MLSTFLRAALLTSFAVLLAGPARATWSIVVLNRVTGEVAVATSTCIQNSDICNAVPVVRVGYAAGASQAAVIFNASNKRRIFRNSLRGATPQQLLDLNLANDGGFNSRQFGIVAFAGPPVTFTGAFNFAEALGVAGQDGPYDYAIQGNILTGPNVVFDAQAAFLGTSGDLGQKMLAAMEAARDGGGDGRCSCNNSDPTGCGSPPASFNYASYNACMVIARHGDIDGNCTAANGCINGSYYLRLSYVGNSSAQEPIAALSQLYGAWRNGQMGRPDHILTEVTSSVPLLQADGATTSRVTLRLRDIEGTALTQGGQTVTVVRREGDAVATVQNLVDNGDGTHSFDLLATQTSGTGTYVVTVDDGIRPVELYPPLEVTSEASAELHIGSAEYSASEGTELPLIVNRGAAESGRSYRILASLSGTSPGASVGGVMVPLNRDRLLNMTIRWPGGAPFTGNVGQLDADGRAEARFFPPAGALNGFVGSTLSFSALVGGQDVTAPAEVVVTL